MDDQWVWSIEVTAGTTTTTPFPITPNKVFLLLVCPNSDSGFRNANQIHVCGVSYSGSNILVGAWDSLYSSSGHHTLAITSV